MLAWCVLTGHRPEGWEVDVLRRLDGVYVKLSNVDSEKQVNVGEKKP